MSEAIFQCVPNVSEGRRTEVIEAVAAAIRGCRGVCLMDYSGDADHNRSVFTMLGTAGGLRQAVSCIYEEALRSIDMHDHSGVHPRIGAVDVVPFVPFADASMEEAAALCLECASEIAARFEVPIYLYGNSASDDKRSALPFLRRGGWEALNSLESLDCEDRRPDLGPLHLHPSLGASCFGARGPLVAFNAVLNTSDVTIAKKVASRVRGSSGGLRGVRALGLELPSKGLVQVSMNLTEPDRTAMYTALELVRMEARRFGADVVSTELIGGVSMAAVCDSLSYYMQLPELKPSRVLETGLLELRAKNCGV